MKKNIQIKLLPAESVDNAVVREYAAAAVSEIPTVITGFNILKRSIDARSKQPMVLLTLEVFIHEPYIPVKIQHILFKELKRDAKKVIIVGAGPAGLFAALYLIEKGIQPIILERGRDVRSRRRDLAQLNKEGFVNPESNYCFGEGGAGTYSDGKLYTRSNKRGDINRILQILVQFGAPPEITQDAHPHIGTNKLPQIITSIRHQIELSGGIFLFEKKVIDFKLDGNKITSVKCADGNIFEADAVILATGHSARDIFILLQQKKITIEFKSFALGVRIEHPQTLIDRIQYHSLLRDRFLPPASYSFVEQVNSKGVFSFCMCPGGIIAPAATAPGELVVNGWSPSKRNNPFANSGIVVTIEENDTKKWHEKGALAGMYFQQDVEQSAFVHGGGQLKAPAQRMIDFTENRHSATLPSCSYIPGLQSANIEEVLPGFIADSLTEAFIATGKKMKSYFTNEAVIVATESRSSSPVRIPRNPGTFNHPQIPNLYPCGEGAGYAGGIVSAAMDGERVASRIADVLI